MEIGYPYCNDCQHPVALHCMSGACHVKDADGDICACPMETGQFSCKDVAKLAVGWKPKRIPKRFWSWDFAWKPLRKKRRSKTARISRGKAVPKPAKTRKKNSMRPRVAQ